MSKLSLNIYLGEMLDRGWLVAIEKVPWIDAPDTYVVSAEKEFSDGSFVEVDYESWSLDHCLFVVFRGVMEVEEELSIEKGED